MRDEVAASEATGAGVRLLEYPYLTLDEAAALLRLSPKTVANKVSAGELIQGVHYFRRKGMAARFKRAALIAWLEGRDPDLIPMARRRASNGL